ALKVGKGLAVVQKVKAVTAKVMEAESANWRMGQRKKELGRASAGKLKVPKAEEILFSEMFACPKCAVNLPEIEPRIFSFNSPEGACSDCTGLGRKIEVDPKAVIPNKNLTLAEGAIRPWMTASHRVGRQSWYWMMLTDLAERYHFSLNAPVSELPSKIIDLILYGDPSTIRQTHGGEQSRTICGEQGRTTGSGQEKLAPSGLSRAESREVEGKFEGVIPNLERRWRETDSEFTRREIEKYMLIRECPTCRGRRLRAESLAVKIVDLNIAEVSGFPVGAAVKFFERLAIITTPATLLSPR
ncbi:MAG: hypothetical protein Q8L57_01575, partial [bacterium]|nr:hypothetical protein [bacterium]